MSDFLYWLNLGTWGTLVVYYGAKVVKSRIVHRKQSHFEIWVPKELAGEFSVKIIKLAQEFEGHETVEQRVREKVR